MLKLLTRVSIFEYSFFFFGQDVGCGGGILSERLARLGADVTGIDPVQVLHLCLEALHFVVYTVC